MIEFKNRKWIVYGASGYPAYITPFGVVPAQEFLKLYGITNEGIGLWKGRTFDWFFDEVQLISISETVLPKLLEQQWDYYSEWQKEARNFDDAHYELFSLDIENLPEPKLLEWMSRYYNLFISQYRANDLIEPLSFYFQHHLKDLLAKRGVPADEAKKLSDMYGTPCRENYIKQCVREYKEKGPESMPEILRKYHYIKSDFTGTISVTEGDIKEFASKEIDKEPEKQETVSVSDDARKLLTVLQIVATIQDVRKAESLMWVTGAERLLSEFAKRRKIPMGEILFATWEEILEERFTHEELQERMQEAVFMWDINGISVYTGEVAHDVSSQLRREILGDGEKKEFTGVSASKGNFIGRVKVVIDKIDFGKVEKGDVLVTVMTRPEYLPVMHLAGAFVTDEGGITSHAAIVAREMRKPCVIATQTASKILKDGDLVEVDADNGVVKKLK